MKSLICSAVAIFAIVSVTDAMDSNFDRRCIRVCTDIYLPICGYDGNQYRIFPSECVMEVENCNLLLKSQKAFKKTLMRFCPAGKDFDIDFCPQVCPFLYKPVCANNGVISKTFPNECELKRSICRFGEEWKKTEMDVCKTTLFETKTVDPKQKCLKACHMNWDPICAFDGENYFTFGNLCDMEVQTCLRSEKQWTLIRKGEC